MKNKLIGLCIGLIVGLSSSVFAGIGDKVEAVFAKYSIVVDGDAKQLEADPLVYQDSTYLPLRAVANMLGYDVTYKADSRTIELNTSKEGEAVTRSGVEGETDSILSLDQIKSEIAKWESNLEYVNGEITFLNEKIETIEQNGGIYSGVIDPRDVIQATLNKKQTALDKLAELQAKKAELEAQQ